MSSAAGTRAVLFAEVVGLARSLPRGFYLKHARNSDAAVIWIPAFAGMTSCPPFDFAMMLSFISCFLLVRVLARVLASSWTDTSQREMLCRFVSICIHLTTTISRVGR